MKRWLIPFALFPAWLRAGLAALAIGIPLAAPAQQPLAEPQALEGLVDADPARRLAAMLRLAEIGTAAHADAVLPLLADARPALRQVALALVWQLWSRSGDPAIDSQYEQGMALMRVGDLPRAVQVFSDIIAQRPAFAEAWNKRATLYFMMGRYDLSMQDCDAVLARIPQHFGALSGYAQMLAERDQPERALEYLERARRIHPDMAGAETTVRELRRRIELKRRQST